MNTKTIRTRICALQFEQLEDRFALAGNVLAALSASGDLSLRGDSSINDISLSTDALGRVVIEGTAGSNTTVTLNGQTNTHAILDLSGILGGSLRNVSINSGTALTVPGSQEHIDLGLSGADRIAVDGLNITGKLSISGSGAGVVTLADSTVGGKTDIRFGTGVSSLDAATQLKIGSVIHLAGSTLGVSGAARSDVNVVTSSTRDTVSIDLVIAGRDVNISTGADADTISLGLGASVTVGGRLNVNAGLGDDVVSLDGLDVAGRTSLDVGSGNDSLTVVAAANGNAAGLATFGGDFSASLGLGNNQFDLAAIAVTGKVKIAGGAGADVVNIGGATGSATLGSDVSVNLGAGSNQFALANAAATGKVTVSSGSGADVVTLGDVDGVAATNFGGDLTLQLGSGANRVTLANIEVAGKTRLDLGSGADLVTIGNANGTAFAIFNGDANINLGAGVHDVLSVRGTLSSLTLPSLDAAVAADAAANVEFQSSLQVNGGAGSDSISVVGTEVRGNLSVDTGFGDDLLVAADVGVLTSANLSAGFGNDLLALGVTLPGAGVGSLVAGRTNVDLGFGDDRLSVAGDARLHGNLNVEGGFGNDTLALGQQTTFGGDLSAQGGLGANTFLNDLSAGALLDSGASVEADSFATLAGQALADAQAALNAEIEARALAAFPDLFP